MSKMVSINEFDIVFISYDEPNADENYNNLIEKAPWAKRSHGVFGSDAAHKAAADIVLSGLNGAFMNILQTIKKSINQNLFQPIKVLHKF